MFKIDRQPIYRHTELDPREAAKYKPLMEAAFRDHLSQYDNRPELKAEKLKFITEQYANRVRVSKAVGESPLFEDAKIFGGINSSLKALFESVGNYSQPGNILNMGNVQNPMNATDLGNNLGQWNQGYKPGTGDVPSYVFGLQNHIALHCIGFDLLPTIAVDTPKVVTIYVDTVYGGGPLDDPENQPSYIELSSAIFTRNFINTNSLVRGTTKLVITTDDGTDGSAVEVLFFLGSTVKTAITAEVLGTGTFNAAAAPVKVSDITWDDSVSVIDIVDLVNTAGSINVVYIEGALNAGEIPLTAANLSGVTFSELYAGYASSIRNNIAEASSNDNSLGGMNRAQHEKGPVNKLNVVTIDKQFEMVGLEIEADTTNIQIKDMAAMGVNVISYLYTGVQNQIVQSLDETILNHLYRLGVTSTVNAYLSQGINYSLYIGATGTANKAFTAVNVPFIDIMGNDRKAHMGNIVNVCSGTMMENQMTHNDRLYSRILVVAEFVELQTRISPADNIVVGGELAAAIKHHSSFVVSPTPTTITKNAGLQYYGTVFGNISLFKNPKIDFDDPRILFIRRGDEKDPGCKLLAYDLAASRQIVAEGTMAEKIRVWSRFSLADIGFYPELNYHVIVAVNDFKFA